MERIVVSANKSRDLQSAPVIPEHTTHDDDVYKRQKGDGEERYGVSAAQRAVLNMAIQCVCVYTERRGKCERERERMYVTARPGLLRKQSSGCHISLVEPGRMLR